MAEFSNYEFLSGLLKGLADLGQLQIRKARPKLIRAAGGAYYCKIGGVGSFHLYFYCGPYLQVDTVWVGFGAPKKSQFATLRKLCPAPVLKNEHYEDDARLVLDACKTVQQNRFVYEDLVGSGCWKWFGSYMPAERRNVAKAIGAVELLIEAVGSDGASDLPPWIEPTERDAVRKVRLAQKHFRRGQLDVWGGKCCVTGCGVKDVLRASHINGWAEKPDTESRTSKSNGLLLISTLDALFDRHLISFEDDGTMLQSAAISGQKIMGLRPSMEIEGGLSEEQAKRMKSHRELFKSKQAAYLRSRSAN